MDRTSNQYLVIFAVMAFAGVAAGFATAATVTDGITYQGKVTDGAGNPLTGSYSVKFSLYEVSAGGTALASSTQPVTSTNGVFTTPVMLGRENFDGRALWLGIKVGSDPEMTPRQEIRPVPYALGLRPGAWVTGTDASPSMNLRNGGGGIALNVSAGGYGSEGLSVKTTGQSGTGIRALTSGYSSTGVVVSTSGSYSGAVNAATTGPYSHGASVSTNGYSSDGISATTTGDNSRGIVAETYGYDSDGLHSFSQYGNGISAEAGLNGGFAGDFKGNVNIRSKSTGESILELGEGLDYSEGFDLSGKDTVTPGTVLVISPDVPGTLTASTEPYDRKVAGIVAGAGGLNSAIRVGGGYDASVALAGRVYCNVDATYAAVEPGDQLTTSATPGYAMAVQDYPRAQGATIGKAMEGLEQGKKGQILVLVTLQ